jgi:23S rRNA pseudouridine2605 synthase
LMSDTEQKKERIAKRMARAGLCSRRDAERWIEDGRVVVNGTKLTSPAFTVDDSDNIEVDGRALPRKERARLWKFHKPAGLVTSHRDEKGRETVFDILPDDFPRVISVGRLDLNSEGLLLLTNDGELARRLELPATGWKRKYRVRVHGHPRKAELARLANGITIDGVRYGSIEAELDGTKGANSWLTISIREGKNREIRRVMEHLEYPVLRLIRTSYGPIQLGELEVGETEEVKSKILRDQMGVEKYEDNELETPTFVRGQNKPSRQGRTEQSSDRRQSEPSRRGRTEQSSDRKQSEPSRRGRTEQSSDRKQSEQSRYGRSEQSSDRRQSEPSRRGRTEQSSDRRQSEQSRYGRSEQSSDHRQSEQSSDRPQREKKRPTRHKNKSPRRIR